MGGAELTHKFHTARAQQTWIIFLDVSDGFVYQFFDVLYAHSFPCWARLKRQTANAKYLRCVQRWISQGKLLWGLQNCQEET